MLIDLNIQIIIVQSRFRYSVKLIYDRVVLGMDEDEDIFSQLHQYEESYVAPSSTPQWRDALSSRTTNLFEIYFDEVQVDF